MKILITGAAGFIGYHTAKKFISNGDYVTGLDNINDYYSVKLKEARLNDLGVQPKLIEYGKTVASVNYPNFRFLKCDITDRELLPIIFKEGNFDCVINLAAQAGVRYSIDHPWNYIESNIVGFFNVLECCRQFNVGHLVYASSSSIYGNNDHVPFSEKDRVDNPESLYAATKKLTKYLQSAITRFTK